MNIHIHKNIRHLRKKKGLSCNRIEQLLDVKYQFSKWEHTKKRPSYENVLKMAKYFGVSFEDLIFKDLTK